MRKDEPAKSAAPDFPSIRPEIRMPMRGAGERQLRRIRNRTRMPQRAPRPRRDV
jgi:hypothetical protein